MVVNSRLAPSRQLLTVAAAEITEREQFSLLDEQQVAFTLVANAVEEARGSDRKTVVIVTAGPGSGKSVIALSLLGEMSRRGYAALHATGSAAFTGTMRRVAGHRNRRVQQMFHHFNQFGDAAGMLRSRQAEGYSARMTAGLCWPWSDAKAGQLVPDVRIGDWHRPWNNKLDRALGDALARALWASMDGGFGQIGCVCTAQGFEHDNAAVGHISDAAGAGIFSAIGDLRIESSKITGNRSVPAPNEIGRYAEGGGVFVASGNFTVRSSAVNGNTVDLATAWPELENGGVVEAWALGAALHLNSAGKVLIEDSQINGNVAKAVNPNSDTSAWGVVMIGEAPSVSRRSTMKGNVLSVRAATTAVTNGGGPVIQFLEQLQVFDT